MLEVGCWKLERRCESDVSFCLTWGVKRGDEEKQRSDSDEEENGETAETAGADGQNFSSAWQRMIYSTESKVERKVVVLAHLIR